MSGDNSKLFMLTFTALPIETNGGADKMTLTTDIADHKQSNVFTR